MSTPLPFTNQNGMAGHQIEQKVGAGDFFTNVKSLESCKFCAVARNLLWCPLPDPMLTYAKFNDRSNARGALLSVRPRLGRNGKASIVGTFAHHAVPTQVRAAGRGAGFGAMGGLGVAASLLALGYLVTHLVGFSVPAEGATLALVIGLSVAFGALAGGLSFASTNRADLGRVQRWIRDGECVLLVRSRTDPAAALRGLGAVELCSLR